MGGGEATLFERLRRLLNRPDLVGRTPGETFRSTSPLWTDENDPIPHSQVVQPVGIMGRRDARHLANIVDTSDRIRTAITAVLESTPTVPIADSGDIAGNAAITNTPLAGGSGLYEIDAILYSYGCGVAVASRTAGPPAMTDVTGIFAQGAYAGGTTDVWKHGGTLALTASQVGLLALIRRNEAKNQNGTLTMTESKMDTPFKANSTALNWTAPAATNGAATDFHRIAVLGRQVA